MIWLTGPVLGAFLAVFFVGFLVGGSMGRLLRAGVIEGRVDRLRSALATARFGLWSLARLSWSIATTTDAASRTAVCETAVRRIDEYRRAITDVLALTAGPQNPGHAPWQDEQP